MAASDAVAADFGPFDSRRCVFLAPFSFHDAQLKIALYDCIRYEQDVIGIRGATRTSRASVRLALLLGWCCMYDPDYLHN